MFIGGRKVQYFPQYPLFKSYYVTGVAGLVALPEVLVLGPWPLFVTPSS